MSDAAAIYNGLNFTTKEVNSNFKIKVNGINFSGQKMNVALGVAWLINLVGIENANTLIDRAFNNNSEKCICRLRRGLKITFYSH